MDMDSFSFDDLKQIKRSNLGDFVPLELYRAIRLIGMYQGLPMKGKGTTITVGRKIGESLPVNSIADGLKLFQSLNIGVPTVIEQTESELIVQVEDCFCKGLPHRVGHFVCDLEGAILEGAVAKVTNKKVKTKEVKCNVNGDSCCEYEVKIY